MAHEAAAKFSAVDFSVEYATLYLHVTADAEATRIASAADGGAAHTVGDVARVRASFTDDSGGAISRTCNTAAYDEVLDGGAIDIAEWCSSGIVVRVLVADGQRLAVSVECTGKGGIA